MTLALVALAAAVWLWPPRSTDEPGRRPAYRRATPLAAELPWLPLLLDLTAAGLEAGLPLDVALTRAAPARLPWLQERLGQVAGLLRLGADARQAWQPLAAEPALRALAVTSIRSATSGIKLAANLTDLATELRADGRAVRLARAQRAGVWVIVPLGLCFLPAFVCIGIVPTVIGIASTVRG
jgi:pilus assembly protein TadC